MMQSQMDKKMKEEIETEFMQGPFRDDSRNGQLEDYSTCLLRLLLLLRQLLLLLLLVLLRPRAAATAH